MSVNLHALHSKLNEAIANLFDSLGVKRTFTVPYVDGEAAASHVAAVGEAAKQNNGLVKNFTATFHHSGGKGWGSGDGQTVGYPTHDLRQTLIPKNYPQAQAALLAARHLLNAIQSLLPNDKATKNSQAQLDLVGKNGGSGMTALDFGTALQLLVTKPVQSLARAHNGVKPGGHSPKPQLPVATPQGNSNV